MNLALSAKLAALLWAGLLTLHFEAAELLVDFALMKETSRSLGIGL